MRWTVLTSDVLIFFPAVLWFIIVYASQSKGYKSNLPWHVAMILLNPCLILIDHGHFQACIKYWSKYYKYQHIFLSITTLTFQFFSLLRMHYCTLKNLPDFGVVLWVLIFLIIDVKNLLYFEDIAIIG